MHGKNDRKFDYENTYLLINGIQNFVNLLLS